QNLLVAEHRDGRELGEHFDAGLRLLGLARLGAKAVDEGLQVSAPLLLLFQRLFLQGLLLAALALELGVAAAPQAELAAIEMQDVVGDLVEQIAVMADDDDRRRAMR